jgi:hypothetical protein
LIDRHNGPSVERFTCEGWQFLPLSLLGELTRQSQRIPLSPVILVQTGIHNPHTLLDSSEGWDDILVIVAVRHHGV